MRKALYALLLAPLLFTACNKKSDDPPANEFIINGIHDVNLGSTTTGGNILALSVAQTSGTQQPVTITATGLPAGVKADIQPASGTPAFGATVTFSLSGYPTAGTYQIHIVGTSSSYTRTYDLNLIVPALNGFTLGDSSYNRSSLMHTTYNVPPYVASQILISSFDYGSAYLSASISEVWPTTDGTYTYHIGGQASNAMSLSFDAGGSSSSSYDTDRLTDTSKMATVTISGGKYSLRISNVPLTSYDGSVTKTLTVNASE